MSNLHIAPLTELASLISLMEFYMLEQFLLFFINGLNSCYLVNLTFFR